VNPRAGLDVLEKTTVSYPCRDLNPIFSSLIMRRSYAWLEEHLDRGIFTGIRTRHEVHCTDPQWYDIYIGAFFCACLSVFCLCPSACPSARLSVRPSMSARPSACPSAHPSVSPPVRPSVRPSVCPSIFLPVRPAVCLPALCGLPSNKSTDAVPCVTAGLQ
jgi:hypothetical protein